MATVGYILAALAIVIVITLAVLAQYCFDDNDPDLNWYDNYSVIECPHTDKTDIVVNVAGTCEEVYTMCDDCHEVLNIRTDC